MKISRLFHNDLIKKLYSWCPDGPIRHGLLVSLFIGALCMISVAFVVIIAFNLHGYLTGPRPFSVDSHAFSGLNPLFGALFSAGFCLFTLSGCANLGQIFLRNRLVLLDENKVFWSASSLESKLDKSAKLRNFYSNNAEYLMQGMVLSVVLVGMVSLFNAVPPEFLVSFILVLSFMSSMLAALCVIVRLASIIFEYVASKFSGNSLHYLGKAYRGAKVKWGTRGAFERLPSSEKEAAKQIAKKLNLDITHSNVMCEVLSDYRARQKRAYQEAKVLGEKTQNAEVDGQSRRL